MLGSDFGLKQRPFSDDIRFLVGIESPIDTCLNNSLFRIGRFKVESYSDDLFEKNSVHFPEALRQAFLNRRAEYLAGRLLAKQLFGEHGVDASNISTDSLGCPLWPNDWVGSISHSHGIVACRIGLKSTYHGLGVDVERVMCRETFFHVKSQFLSQEEASLITQCNLKSELVGTIVFSAKESIFKAFYPEVRRFFSFSSVQLETIDTSSCALTFKLTETLSDRLLSGFRVVVRFTLLFDYVMTDTVHLTTTRKV